MADTMTLRQLAAYLQMSVHSVYHLVRLGKIPGVKIGKQWRFSKAAIDRWLASTTAKSARVLVVEKDDTVCDLILKVLHSAGHQAVGVATAREAITLLGQVTIDIAIVDLALPESSGADVVDYALKLAERPELLVVSGAKDSSALRRVKALVPYVTVLHRPLDLDALVELVGRRAGRT